jgi:D-beta-D-heptose 7-phosphate kinase/D-beta-D-heptose 1-phosphate adenosyltransferase
MSAGSASDKVLTRDALIARFGPGRAETVVFTNGCFDLLHVGHVTYLERARKLGDALVVGVNTDASARRLDKGSGGPYVPEADRARVLAALETVDAVCLFDEDTPAELIAALAPDVLVKGADYTLDQVVGRETVEAGGGRVELIELVDGRSTTELVRRIQKGAGDE